MMFIRLFVVFCLCFYLSSLRANPRTFGAALGLSGFFRSGQEQNGERENVVTAVV